MQICFFGSYEKDYSKNAILIDGFKRNNIDVVHCFHPNYFTFAHYPSLFWQFFKKARKCEVIFVAFFGHYDVWFAWIVAKTFRKKLVFDPLISVYNTLVEDRKYFRPKSFKAKFYIFFDWLNVHLADMIFLDTYAHLAYYKKMFHIDERKIAIVRVGADRRQLVPNNRSRTGSTLTILFYGYYHPSQGVLKMVQAAKVLKKEKIEWQFVGTGQDRLKAEAYASRHQLTSVKFIEPVSFLKLAEYINSADILLGVFGDTIKTRMVIHNKIFQALAMGKPLITQDTPAVREILIDNKNAFLVNAKPQLMAKKILIVAHDNGLRKRVGKNARKLFLTKFTSDEVAKQAKEALEKVLN